ncbi:MAG: hypothetical protein A3E87_09575 [Gammaproteobacteria bacterium RIFCSPHIGHO2_12_FULL_35_23]|nr:MAG: hypothetical protein A3E87_09575 [Gammaproteobacteria bacterium RIFCSPHIGHO2_12_FULL_35_23]
MIVSLGLLASFTIAQAQAAQPLDSIAAVVNDQVITNAEINTKVNLIESQLQASNTPMPNPAALRTQVLQQMINETLQLQMASRYHLKVSKEQLEQALQHVAEQNGLTVEELYQSAEKNGFTVASFNKELKKEILMQMVQQQAVSSRISISEEEVDDYLANLSKNQQGNSEYDVADILITLPDSPTPEQVQQAESNALKVVQQLKQGTNFKQLAIEVSGGAQALQGGDLGWRKLAELPTPFVPYAEKMKANQVAGPIRTPNGFHVIKLLGVRSVADSQGTPDEQRKQVEEMIYEREFNQALLNWIAQLRAQAYIKIY